MIVVSGPSASEPGGTTLTVQNSAPDDPWLNYWSPGRTVGVTAISDIDGDGADDIAYLKGGQNGASDYRLIVVSGPTLSSPGEQFLAVQEFAPDDHWLDFWSKGRTVQISALKLK